MTSGRSNAQSWAPEYQDVKNYKWRLNPVWHRVLYSCTHMATVGVKGLKNNWTHWDFTTGIKTYVSLQISAPRHHNPPDWIGLSIVLRPRQHSIGYMGDGFYRSIACFNNYHIDINNLANKTTEYGQLLLYNAGNGCTISAFSRRWKTRLENLSIAAGDQLFASCNGNKPMSSLRLLDILCRPYPRHSKWQVNNNGFHITRRSCIKISQL